MNRAALASMQMDGAGLPKAFEHLMSEGEIQVEGDATSVVRLLGRLEEFDGMFNVVEP